MDDGEELLKLEEGYAVGSLPSLFYISDFISDSEQAQLLRHIYEAPFSKWKSLVNRRLQNWGGVVHEKGLLPQELPPWLTKITQRICKQTGLFPEVINHVLINEYLPDQGIMPHQDGPAYFPVVAILSLGSPVVMDFTPHLRLKDWASRKGKIAEGSIADSRAAVVKSEDMSNDLICEQTNDHTPFSLLLMPRSLFIFKDEAYSDYLHGIEDSDTHRLHKAVNICEALKPQVQNSSPSSEETLEGNDTDQAYSIHRATTRVSLTCRLVLKVHRNLFKF